MAVKTQKSSSGPMGWPSESMLERSLKCEAKDGRRAEVFVHLGKTSTVPKDWRSYFSESESSSASAVRIAETSDHVRVLIAPLASSEPESEPGLKASLNTRIRDTVGATVSHLERLNVANVHFGFDLQNAQIGAAVLGLEMALYRFQRAFKSEAPKFRIELSQVGKPLSTRALSQGIALGRGVNLARHLVNLPPNILNPLTYAEFAAALFSGLKNVRVEIWDEKRLQSENMGLHFGVGRASATPPRLVHIKYRNGGPKRGPVAFVGKGITFDSGGLDIKPSSGMRLMKKDMGGSAAVLGLAYWAALTGWVGSADFYLALAENAVSGDSFRPGDVLTSRNGMTVEIHNTDAEGRLVLADAMDVAVTADPKPRALIDVATLTGAIKVALGSGLTGLFSNDPKLSAALCKAGQESGDPAWPMPLMQKYRSGFSSPFADVVNSVDGFGGAITAALFLEKFARDVPWAHLDIYSWKDSAEGAWLESGGSGQAVFTLAEWLSRPGQGR